MDENFMEILIIFHEVFIIFSEIMPIKIIMGKNL